MSDLDTVTPSQEYIKGFNLGYELSKEKPELALSLIDKLPESEKSAGFKDGWKQNTLEKTMEEKPRHLSKENDKVGFDKDNRDIIQDKD